MFLALFTPGEQQEHLPLDGGGGGGGGSLGAQALPPLGGGGRAARGELLVAGGHWTKQVPLTWVHGAHPHPNNGQYSSKFPHFNIVKS